MDGWMHVQDPHIQMLCMCLIPGKIALLRRPRDATADAPRAAPAITSWLASTQGLHSRKHRENQRDHQGYQGTISNTMFVLC